MRSTDCHFDVYLKILHDIRFTLCICMCAVMCFKVTHVKRSRCSQKFKEKKKNTTDLIPLATAWLRGRLVAVLQVTPTQLLCNACCYF